MTRPLSAAQIQALQAAADGICAKRLAIMLGIGVWAATDRRKSAMRKLGQKTMPGAVAAAMRAGVVR